jgi:hypothetical protein
MKRLGVVTLAVAAVVAVAATAAAVASHFDGPKTDSVLANFSFASVREKQRLCEGDDGPTSRSVRTTRARRPVSRG